MAEQTPPLAAEIEALKKTYEPDPVSSRVARMAIVGVVSLWLSMLSLAEAARAPTRPFQMSILATTDTLLAAGVDIPIFTQNVFSTYQPQPAGRSIAWLPPDPNLDRHAIDWSRIVAVLVDEPYGEILKNRTSCVGTPSPIADIMKTLEAMAAEVRRRAPSARFWVNFTKKDIDLMHSPTAECPLNQPYIDVISMDIYGVAFKPTLRDRYNYLLAHRATSSQQLALVPGTFTEGWEKQSGRQGAARLSGYFDYAASMNRQCNLPLGPRGVTGTYDGCPVWIVAGFWGGTTPLDYDPRDYFPIEHSKSAPVLKAWRRQFAVPRVDPSRHDNASVDGFGLASQLIPQGTR